MQFELTDPMRDGRSGLPIAAISQFEMFVQLVANSGIAPVFKVEGRQVTSPSTLGERPADQVVICCYFAMTM